MPSTRTSTRSPAFRLAGFRVVVSWSALVVFALIAWSLASSVLPAGFPGQAPGAYWAAGLGAAFLFLAGLLAHELAHALVARRSGGPQVQEITLWLFGGLARVQGEMPSPGVELRVAAAGPAASLLVGGVFLAAAALAGVAGAPPLLGGALLWLAVMNLALAVFNLIPGAPLDGGRILRAVLWRLRGDPTRAALTAARAGRAAGLLLVGVGLLQLVVGATLGGLWTALVGWFLMGAAGAEASQARVRAGLHGLLAGEVMAPVAAVGPAWFTVDAFLDDWAPRHPAPAWPLQRFDGGPAGVVAAQALRLVPPADRSRVRVAELAVPAAEVPVARPEEPAAELALRLAAAGRGVALVLAGGRPVGVVTASGLAAAARRARPGAPPGSGVGQGPGAGTAWAARPGSGLPR
jgi:Zn-dependent protease